MKLLFLYLNAYSAVGGIQKFNKNFINALDKIQKENGGKLNLVALYDHQKDFPLKAGITGFSTNGNKLKFILKALRTAQDSDKIIIGHSNLLFPIVFLLKLFYPQKTIILITHGIEIWNRFHFIKRYSLNICDKVLSVSNFTKSKIIDLQGATSSKITLFPNTLDNEFEYNHKHESKKPAYLLERYNIDEKDKVILTLARLSDTEKFKGYDLVIEALPYIKANIGNVKYVIAGKADEKEILRLNKIIAKLGLQLDVVITGYVKDSELIDHYRLCDLFIMPSKKEGFGIVFIEALVCGKPVIGGNLDGSVDALLGGELGFLINPDRHEEIGEAIKKFYNGEWPERLTDRSYLRNKTLENFGFSKFKDRLKEILL